MTYLYQVDNIQDIFGWIQLLLINLDLWDMIGFTLQVMLVVSITMYLISRFRN